jgi:hypothetical protein
MCVWGIAGKYAQKREELSLRFACSFAIATKLFASPAMEITTAGLWGNYISDF